MTTPTGRDHEGEAAAEEIAPEEILVRALDAVPTPVMVLSAEQDIEFVNAAAAETFDLGEDDLVGRSFDEFVTMPAHDDEAGLGIKASGEQFPATSILTPLGPADDDPVIAVISDLSEEKRTEERLRKFILAAHNPMALVHGTGRIVLSNTAMQLLFGYSASELTKMTIDELVPGPDGVPHGDLFSHMAGDPERPDVSPVADLLARAHDGADIPVSITFSPVQVLGGDHVVASIRDLDAQLREQARLTAAEAYRLQSAMLDNLPFSVVAIDLDGTIASANPAALRLLGCEADELVGHPFVSIHDPDELRRLAVDVGQFRGRRETAGFDLFKHLARGPEPEDREMTYSGRHGTTVPVSQLITEMRDETGRLHGYLAVAHDITRRREVENDLAHMTTHDQLTGLPNRETFVSRVDALIAGGTPASFAVACFDLDRFGQFNEALGHHAGDDALIRIAHDLTTLVPMSHLIARVGGDKFAVVLEGTRDAVDVLAATLMRELLTSVADVHPDFTLSASVGAARFPDDAGDGANLVKSADAAVSSAKSDDRGSVSWFDPAANDQNHLAIRLQAALPQAIDNGELAMHYQPLMSLSTGLIVGVEALARWSSPEFGSVSPTQFIAIAEDSGLIGRLGAWSLDTACADMVHVQQVLGQDLSVAVNVSPQQFRDGAFAGIVEAALATSGLDPQHLDLEITENIFIAHPHRAIEAIEAVQSQGVSVVLDDFGTGYSSFSYLTRFPFDKIKIDRSFVERLVSGGADAAIVEAIISMAHTLGMSVVAEGVEMTSQATFLNRHGCDEAQGFLYSPALPLDELIALIRTTGHRIIGDDGA